MTLLLMKNKQFGVKCLTPNQIDSIIEKGVDPLLIHNLRNIWAVQLKRINHKNSLCQN